MVSENYNAYSYPYQQSSTQQYPAYQTAPTSSNPAQPSRQYQQPASTQAGDYMSYAESPYGAQATGYGHAQDDTWSDTNHGSTRETTRGAAEVLRNMSNNSYAPSNASASTRYAASNSRPPQVQQSRPPNAPYGQSQVRLRSVNTNQGQTTTSRGLLSHAGTAGYRTGHHQQQQRSSSPAQAQYNATPTSSARSSTLSVATGEQQNDWSSRKLPDVGPVRAPQPSSTSNSYNYAGNHMSGSAAALTASNANMDDPYNAPRATTVDPLAVYDPYADIQRRAELACVQKAQEDAARAEEERTAEEARRAEELKVEQTLKRQQEEEALHRPQPRPKAKKPVDQLANLADAVTRAETSEGTTEDLEAAMRAMMAKMRELNSKDPALLARIWEEERRAKAPKSPTTQDKPAPQVPPVLTTQSVSSVPSIPASVPPIAKSKKKTVRKEPVVPAMARTATPAQPPPTSARPQAQAVPSRPSGNTFWPPEKRAQLANAAVSFLNAHNPTFHMDPGQILSMLDSNPSYIQLCEQLEQIGLRLDRAAFARSLLTAVPDVNSGSRKAASHSTPVPIQRPMVPPAVMKKEVVTPAAVIASPQHTPSAALLANNSSQTPHPTAPVPIAEMVPIKAELKPPANKEEAARKRNLSELIDLTQLSDDDELGPPVKRHHSNLAHSFGSPHLHVQDALMVDAEPTIINFPIANIPRPIQEPVPQPALAPIDEFRHYPVVESLDRKKALRRNNYNPATIARDVLLACGRHPSERQLNQHLDGLRAVLGIPFESDLSTLRWDILDPGTPPPGYFKDGVEDLTRDTDDEDESDDERQSRPRASSHGTSGEGGAARVQALPEAINPFKQKRRGRPQRHSLPAGTAPATPNRSPSITNMRSSAPRPNTTAGGVGYHAFRSATEYGPDGKPLPKKKGRPVGWRKAIHGSATALARTAPNGHTGSSNNHRPSEPSSLHDARTDGNQPIRIDSRSPSVANRAPQLQSYKCHWQNCEAELHNLETLKKHVFKVHRRETAQNTLECSWSNCGKQVASHDTLTNMVIEQHTPHSFDRESDWRQHLQQSHFDPLSWKLGDGPASGLSGKEDN